MRSHFLCRNSKLKIVLAEMAEPGKISGRALQRIIAKAAAGLLFGPGTAFVPAGIITEGAVRFNFISKKPFFSEHEFIPREYYCNLRSESIISFCVVYFQPFMGHGKQQSHTEEGKSCRCGNGAGGCPYNGAADVCKSLGTRRKKLSKAPADYGRNTSLHEAAGSKTPFADLCPAEAGKHLQMNTDTTPAHGKSKAPERCSGTGEISASARHFKSRRAEDGSKRSVQHHPKKIHSCGKQNHKAAHHQR